MAPGPSGAKAARVEVELQEGNMTLSADGGSLMSPGLLKVAERAKRDPDARFNSLAHLVDEAALALTGYSPPDLVEVVYRHRGLSARIHDNRPFIITKEELLQKGQGYGGGLMVAWEKHRDARIAGAAGTVSASYLAKSLGVPPVTDALQKEAQGTLEELLERIKPL